MLGSIWLIRACIVLEEGARRESSSEVMARDEWKGSSKLLDSRWVQLKHLISKREPWRSLSWELGWWARWERPGTSLGSLHTLDCEEAGGIK